MKTIKRFIAAIQIVIIYISVFFFLIIAFVLGLPLVVLSVPWYTANGKGLLKFLKGFFDKKVMTNENNNQ